MTPRPPSASPARRPAPGSTTTLSPDPARRTRSPPDRPEPSTARPPDRRRRRWRPEPAAEPPPPPDRPPGTAPVGVVHEAAGQREAVSRAVARDKPGDVGGHRPR